jgi:hypothetical protein
MKALIPASISAISTFGAGLASSVLVSDWQANKAMKTTKWKYLFLFM